MTDPVELQLKIEEVIRGNGDSALTNLDRRMISRLNELSSKKIEKNLLSEGLFKPTGKNCISLMTTSGAKGGTVSSFSLHVLHLHDPILAVSG